MVGLQLLPSDARPALRDRPAVPPSGINLRRADPWVGLRPGQAHGPTDHDQFHSSARLTRPRRTGFRWRYSTVSRYPFTVLNARSKKRAVRDNSKRPDVSGRLFQVLGRSGLAKRENKRNGKAAGPGDQWSPSAGPALHSFAFQPSTYALGGPNATPDIHATLGTARRAINMGSPGDGRPGLFPAKPLP